MPLQCAHCQNLFFKTLEARILVEARAVMYKKRCKRCKFKHLLQKDVFTGAWQPGTLEDWRAAQAVQLPSGRCADKPRVFVGEYTARISRDANPLPYLRKVRHAETLNHAPTQEKSV